MEPKLLTRDEFRESVFRRDNHLCVICHAPGVDAHHILERRLFTAPEEFGGYFIENGATVCEEHHIACEKTIITPAEARAAAGITRVILPAHLYESQEYDKWGNPVLPNGQRLRGDLFYDESVQKILKDVLPLFVDRVKYPRTPHLPWSPGIHDDDRMIDTMTGFNQKEVVVMEKLDGENTSWYQDYNHARSIDSANHPSRNRMKSIWAEVAGDIPPGWRFSVENLYAKHSIHYTNLENYVYGFAAWNERNFCLDWNTTKEWFELFGIPTPVEFYRGPYEENIIKAIWNNNMAANCEGYVLRTVEGFPYGDFRKHVAKFVRKNHIQTVRHWMRGQEIIPNRLKGE
jgi:hypothetical protein